MNAHDPEIPPHNPVLLRSFLEAAAPVCGNWVDCTFGAGGYSAALLQAGAERVIGIDCDPDSASRGRAAEKNSGGRFSFCLGRFGGFDQFPGVSQSVPLQGVVFDLGASSMQFDAAERGFSFRWNGPLDMRMSMNGLSAADIVNRAPESTLAEIFFKLGEERNSRRIASQIVRQRSGGEITATAQLADIVERTAPRRGRGAGRIHPATKVFQALRIAVNDELRQLARGLAAAERALGEGGCLAVVSFHSLEDRIVKRFMRGAALPDTDRHWPAGPVSEPRFRLVNRRPVRPESDEIAANPRSRSARLRVAVRTAAEPVSMDCGQLGVPRISGLGRI